MKICVLELACAAPEIMFNDERLVNLRRLMDLSLYGVLQNGVPSDSSGDKPDSGNAALKNLAVGAQLAQEGKNSILIGVSSNLPLQMINGIRVGSFFATDPGQDEFTYPASIRNEIKQLVGEDPVGVKDPDRKDSVREAIFAMSRRQWQVLRHLMVNHEWDYLHSVDIGLERVRHAFGNHFGGDHAQYEPQHPYESVIPDYYLWLDEQIGSVMELLDSETILLVVSENSGLDSQAVDARPDGCDPAPCGMFLLAAPNCPLSGEFRGARSPDLVPTLLDLAGYEIPDSMPGRSLVAGMEKKSADQSFGDADSEQLIHDRLAGLGYI